MKVRRRQGLLSVVPVVALMLMSATTGSGQEPGKPQDAPKAQTIEVGPQRTVRPMDPSVAREAAAASSRSLEWLAALQREDGSWSDRNYPALTALPLWAFANSDYPEKKKVIDKAVAFILSCVQEDGGIYVNLKDRKGGGLSNYNTSICMTALHATGREDVIPFVLKARKFVAASQYLGDDAYRGGMGYDWATERRYTDLLNTAWAMEAMRLTESAEASRDSSEKRADLDWTAAKDFLERLQNARATGTDDEGGFPYRPDDSKAGATTNSAGQVVFSSYGSMTYAGLLALIYSDVSRNDPSVRSAFDWACKHWSLDENPGMGPQGLYFFYHVLTKALTAFGETEVTVTADKKLDWRAEIVKRLLALQKIDEEGRGYWFNENSRFMEADKVLTTAYSLLALQMAADL